MGLPDYMENEFKVYVDVNVDFLSDGRIVPRSFVWEDGTHYEIERVIDTRRAASLKAGGAGMRYTVRVRNKEVFMYLEEVQGVDKWFMEQK